MLKRWKSLSYTTKFSIIACVITVPLGLFSMGFLGALLYYPVSFLFTAYPTLNDWSGDWVWPATIGAGMLWGFGFIFGGLVWHYLGKKTPNKMVLRTVYVGVLWVWAAAVWRILITNNIHI